MRMHVNLKIFRIFVIVFHLFLIMRLMNAIIEQLVMPLDVVTVRLNGAILTLIFEILHVIKENCSASKWPSES